MNAAVVDLTPWREPCADFATNAIYARYAKELERFGERGRQTCRQDMLYHLDYLQGALIGDDPGVFTQYALWLKDVLNSRGVPAAGPSRRFFRFSGDVLQQQFTCRRGRCDSGHSACGAHRPVAGRAARRLWGNAFPGAPGGGALPRVHPARPA